MLGNMYYMPPLKQNVTVRSVVTQDLRPEANYCILVNFRKAQEAVNWDEYRAEEEHRERMRKQDEARNGDCLMVPCKSRKTCHNFGKILILETLKCATWFRQEKGFGGLLGAVGRRRGEAVPAAIPQEVQPSLTLREDGVTGDFVRCFQLHLRIASHFGHEKMNTGL